MPSESKAVLPRYGVEEDRPIVFDAWQISADAIEVRLRIRLVRTKRAVRPCNPHNQIADIRPGLRPNMRDRNVMNRKAAVFDVDEQSP